MTFAALLLVAGCDRQDRCLSKTCDVGETCADLESGPTCVCDADREPGPDGGCLIPSDDADAGQ